MRRFARPRVLLLAAALLASAPAGALIWPTVARGIERDLSADDVAVRRRAAERLPELPAPTLERVALRALADSDVEVRLSASRAAKRAALPGLGERLIPWLTESDVRLRIAACEALAEAPSARGVAPLSRALSDAEPAVRRVAASALGESEAKEAVVGLLGRLDDSAVEVREAVVHALASLSDVRAVVPLISKIEDSRPSVRRAVAHALGSLGDRRASSALVLALRDADASVRAAALSAIGALGDPNSAASVASVLASDNAPPVRRAALLSLARLGNDDAVSALIEALGAAGEEREAILAAFSRIGTKAAPALSLCLRAAQPEDKLEGCALALSVTGAPEAGAAIRDALERGRIGPEVALLALGRAGDPETLAVALGYLGHPDAGVRRAALHASGALLDPRRSDGRAVEPLELAFERGQKRRSERLELIRLLGRTGSPRAARLLTPIAERADDLEFRIAALNALGGLGSQAAPLTLFKGLSDSESVVRLAAALAIRQSSPKGLAETVLDRLERGAAQDRRALGLALPGAFAGSVSEAGLGRALAMLNSSRAGERDALIEAIGHAKLPSALAGLAQLARSPDPADRAKVAEMLAFRADAASLLSALCADPDATVRANAVWALGKVASAREAPLVLRALRDSDAATAANAAAALGRLALREKSAAERELCASLDDHRAAVRAAALSALRVVAKRCAEGRERRLLSADRSARVRVSAALLLRDVGTSDQDRRALERCASEDPIGAVGAACEASRVDTPVGSGEVLVFVVPPGEAAPVPRAPFALVRPDGLTRHGAADRRGALCELEVPDGEVELSIHAALDD